MMILRGIWALFLAGFVAYAFRRSWQWEHGAPLPEPVFGGDKPRTKETAVWLDPCFLPLVLLVILIVLGAVDGVKGVERFLSLSLDVMIVISIYFLLLIFLLPVFRRYFSARACATMWILPVFLFWQAHILYRNAPVPRFVICIPSDILKVLFFVWSVGFAVVFIGKFVSHFIFRHRVMSASVPVRDPDVQELFDRELKALEYYRPVRLVISSAAAVPFSMGTMKRNRVTVLPDRAFSQQELEFIFRHEIHHLQRGDVNNKIFFAFCQALCWFNPLIWVAVRKASDDLELSCDEIVLEGTDDRTRKQYAELLLNTAGRSAGFTTCLSAAAETMRYRLKNAVTVRKRLPGTLIISIAMFLCVMSYGTIAVSNEKGTAAELIMGPCTAEDIRAVYYAPEDGTRLEEVFAWDSDGLFSYLAALDAERLSSANEISGIGGQKVSVLINRSGTAELTVHDKYIEVYDFHRGLNAEYYYLRSGADWDTITGYLDFDAERPVDYSQLWPEMRVYFDVPDPEEPIVAVRSKLRVWDTETGETLRAYSSSDSAGGLSGVCPAEARLVFDLPVSEITVRMKEWNSDSQTAMEPDVREECFCLQLESRSAHYQVDVIYEPDEGIQYEATYVFDVECRN